MRASLVRRIVVGVRQLLASDEDLAAWAGDQRIVRGRTAAPIQGLGGRHLVVSPVFHQEEPRPSMESEPLITVGVLIVFEQARAALGDESIGIEDVVDAVDRRAHTDPSLQLTTGHVLAERLTLGSIVPYEIPYPDGLGALRRDLIYSTRINSMTREVTL